MPDYKIFTDATADFSSSMLQGLPRVEVIPMEVTVGDDVFLYGSGNNLSVQQFYAMQRGGKFASTSQINPSTYRKAFESALKEGYDILYLGFSSGMSGCYNNARICAGELHRKYPRRKILCPDTLCASVGGAFLVREALRKQYEGMPIDELADWVEKHKLNVCHWFTVDVFDHLKHGGRVSAASAAVGGMLNIKPMLHVDAEGKLAVMKKPRGRNKAIREQIAKMQEGWQPEISPLVVIGHGDDPEAAEKLKQAVESNFPQADIHIAEIGPIIGAHTGPGMLALIYWGKNR
ncbi:MAG: DegV family protein [Clostridia bacterium]|nr:DegV family protein [Clostridia bacterium]